MCQNSQNYDHCDSFYVDFARIDMTIIWLPSMFLLSFLLPLHSYSCECNGKKKLHNMFTSATFFMYICSSVALLSMLCNLQRNHFFTELQWPLSFKLNKNLWGDDIVQ